LAIHSIVFRLIIAVKRSGQEVGQRCRQGGVILTSNEAGSGVLALWPFPFGSGACFLCERRDERCDRKEELEFHFHLVDHQSPEEDMGFLR